MKLTDRMVEKETDLDEKIAAMQSEIAELHLQLLQDRTKAADTEFFIESGRFEPIECANFRWVWNSNFELTSIIGIGDTF